MNKPNEQQASNGAGNAAVQTPPPKVDAQPPNPVFQVTPKGAPKSKDGLKAQPDAASAPRAAGGDDDVMSQQRKST